MNSFTQRGVMARWCLLISCNKMRLMCIAHFRIEHKVGFTARMN
jgi:hypothetical protein